MATKIGSQSDLLVETILSHAEELRLSDTQIANLSRLYWSTQAGRTVPDVVSCVSSVLSSEQFRVAVGHFAESATVSHSAESVEEIVERTLELRTKDKSVVEMELATNVAERLIGWSKTFGIFLGAPIAVLLLILSLFGVSKFEDVRNAAAKADQLLEQAKSQGFQAPTCADGEQADWPNLYLERKAGEPIDWSRY